MINKRIIGIGIGIVLMMTGLILLIKIPYFYIHSNVVGQKLIKTAETKKLPKIEPTTYHAVSHIQPPVSGALFGTIQIPKLSLTAPLLEGTTTKVLDEGAGHLTTSFMPGENGTSVLAAHNVTWFRHVDQLKIGDPIQIQTSYGKFSFHVTKKEIVKTGDPVYNTTQPSILLIACYPLNALYLTPYRYLVFAQMDQTGKWQQMVTQKNINYKANLPQGRTHHPLTLNNYSLKLGTITYKGSPSMSFTESNAPLTASNSLVQLYLAWLQGSVNKDLKDLSELLPNYKKDIFFGQNLSNITYHSSFNITFNVQQNTLKSMSASIQPVIKGLGTYKVNLVANVNGSLLSLKSIDIVKAN